MPGSSIADAFVTIRPDFGSFDAELARGMRESMGDVTRLAEKAGEAVEDAFREAATQSDAHLEKIGGADVFTEIGTQAQRTGETVERAFKEAATTSDRHLSSIGDGAKAGFGKIAGLIGSLGLGLIAGQAVKFGVATAGSLEQTQVAFEGVLGSAEDAQVLMKNLTDFAAKTPLEMPGLATMTSNLLATGAAFGVNKDTVLDYVTVIGNAASTLGQGQPAMDAVTRALGQMSGTGRVTAQDMNQLQNALPGFSAWDAVAKSMGITQAEARDLGEKGLLPASEAIPALIQGMKDLNGAQGAMERQSQTLVGVLSTFKDTASLALADGLAPLTQGLKDVLTQQPLLDALAGAMGSFGQLAAQAFGAVAPHLDTLLRVLGQAMGILGDVLGAIQPLIGPVLDVISILAEVLSEGLGAALEALAPVINAVASALKPIAETLGAALISLFTKLGPVLDKVGRGFAMILNAGLPILVSIFEALWPVIEQVAGILAGALAKVLPVIARLFEQLAPIIGKLADIVAGVLLDALPVLSAAFDKVFSAMEPLIPVIAEFVGALVEELAPVLPALVDAVLQLSLAQMQLLAAVLPILGPILELLTLLLDLLPIGPILAVALGVLATALEWIGKVVETVVGTVAGWFEWLVDLLVGHSLIPDLIEGITDWFARLPGMIVDALASLVSAVLGVFTAMISAVSGAVTDAIAKVVAWFGELPGKIVSALSALGSAIAGVFSAAWGAITNALSGLWSNISGFFSSLPDRIVSTLSAVGSAIAGVFSGAWSAVSGALNDLWSNIAGFLSGIPGKIGSAISGAAGAIAGGMRSAFTSAWNRMISGLPSFSVDLPGPLPSVSVSLDFLRLALGGIVAGTPYGTPALIGERNRPEAVVPLANPARALQVMDQAGLTSLAASAGGRAAAVSIAHATFVQPVDVDLLFSKASAAVAAGRL